MADGRTVTIKIETVAGANTGAKKILSDLEKDVAASQKRVQANARATDKAILQSQTANINAAKANAKAQATEFIRNMRQMETEARRSSVSIRTSIEKAFSGAFGGGLVGGAVGGFAGSIVGMFATQFAQIPSLLRTHLDEAIKIAAERQNALKGLESISLFKGIDARETQEAVKNLRLVRGGVVDLAEASTALKNLLATGFTLPESVKLLEAFSDAAAFGKQQALGFGEAIRGATEGLKNGNSILVDNVGITKNLSVILKEMGKSEQDVMNITSDASVRQAVYNGLLKEAAGNVGDADKLMKGWTGTTSALTVAQNDLYAAIGNIITRNPELASTIKVITNELRLLTGQFTDTKSEGTSLVSTLTSAFANMTVSLGISIRKEISDLQELVRMFEFVAVSAEAMERTFAGDSAGAQSAWGRADRARKEMGSSSAAAEAYEKRVRAGQYFNQQQGLAQSGMFKSLYGRNAPLSIQRQGIFPTSGPSDAGLIWFGKPGAQSGPGTFSGGGGTADTSKLSKKNRSARIKDVKDELQDAIDLAISHGFDKVTSGSETSTKHKGRGHYDKRAIDFSIKDKKGNFQFQRAEFARQELIEMGYYVPPLRHGTAPHLHVEVPKGGIKRGKMEQKANADYAKYLKEFNPLGGTPTDIGIDDVQGRTKEIEQNENLADAYREAADALFNLNEHTKEEIFLRDYKLGKYGDISEQQAREIADTYRLIDASEKKKKADEEAATERERWQQQENQRLDDLANKQEELFQRTKDGWADLLRDLSEGNFSSIWDRLREQMLNRFIEPASAYLAQLFGGGGGGQMQMAGAGGGGNILGAILGTGMGPGGTATFSGGDWMSGLSGGWDMLRGYRASQGGGGGSFTSAFTNPGRFADIDNSALAGVHGGGIMQNLGALGGPAGASGGGGFSGFLRGMGGGSKMAGIGSGLGAIAQMAGGAIGGKWGNMLSLTGMGAQIGAMFGPWGAAIGAGAGAAAGLVAMLFGGGDDAAKKLKEAAASEFGISVKDKGVLKQLKAVGEQYFGKGQAGKNAQAVVRTEEGMNILRAYAESSGQSGLKIDRLNYGDENWSGNQFKSKFGGFRAMGGSVNRGNWYVVGERGPEVFTPNTSGTITPNGAGGMDPAFVEVLYRVADALESFEAIPAHEVIQRGAPKAKEAIAAANNSATASNLRGPEANQRAQGVYF